MLGHILNHQTKPRFNSLIALLLLELTWFIIFHKIIPVGGLHCSSVCPVVYGNLIDSAHMGVGVIKGQF